MTDYDVIVAGGGPSGSTTARKACQAGLSVLVLDEAKFPRPKPCAGGIPFRVTELLDFDISSVVHRKISGFSLFTPPDNRIDCIPEERSRPGYMVMREDFDNLLLQKAAEAGAEVRDGVGVLDISETSNEIVIVTTEGDTQRSKYLVGADGINSTVAKDMRFYSGWRGDTAMVAIEIEAEVGENKVREICGEPSGYDADLFFLNFGDVPYGYIWCFPKKSVLSLGICCRQDMATNIRSVFNTWFEKFKEKYGLEPMIVSDTSARFPIKITSPLAKGRVLLVGDAAGFVDAFTGEGIAHAIHSGILAAKALKKAVGGNNPHHLTDYEKECKKTIGETLKVSDYFAGIFYKRPENMSIFTDFLNEDEYGRYLVSALIGGLLPAKTVKRKITMRMMRTRPREALSLLK
jgi:geranylgeranyl reductase family protein